ncbi:MFS transporter [Corynebacterium spheniscorum]|uniref:Sugar phosphate permease n=1 Tax=Corynebacterium spheniscorum TaxID=185761 RepID=A0A1I2T4H2_9CORY|nr:MFS transporter [Corynebacterium spheniscorum]KAA8721237.1 MHS family MFS transporter [Corynebacterium spheniscorum]SFG59678.1 Sugar phosphate permease [Corynebacterium spheniscorum]
MSSKYKNDSVVHPEITTSAAERRRVVAATTIGTAIEWYDYFLYASVAGLVFHKLMFGPLEGGLAAVISFATVGISFLFRPLGAFLAGHYGDKLGRRLVLMVTLFTMGGATALIGLLPTYDSIGVAAPILLVLLRILQGVSAGGEWGGAVLLAVEHAPAKKRGLYGAGPQIGVPAGLLLSSGVLAVMNAIAPGEAFLEWGWRVPFLFSIVLVGIGYYIRRGVEESPVFEELVEITEHEAKHPLKVLFREHTPLVFIAALVFAGNGTVGYMTTGGYIQNYATNTEGLAMDRGGVLIAVTLSAASWMVFTLFAGFISDYLGRRNTYILGFILQAIGVFALFPLVNTGDMMKLTIALLGLTVGLGLTYGQQSAMYAELFPASIRASGVSITYAIGSLLGGAFAPMIAAALVRATGSTTAVTGYLVSATIVGLIAAMILRDRTRIPLGRDHEADQASGHFLFSKV